MLLCSLLGMRADGVTSSNHVYISAGSLTLGYQHLSAEEEIATCENLLMRGSPCQVHVLPPPAVVLPPSDTRI